MAWIRRFDWHSAYNRVTNDDDKTYDFPESDHPHHRTDRPDKSPPHTGPDFVALSKLSLEDTGKTEDPVPNHAEFAKLTLTATSPCEAARLKGGRPRNISEPPKTPTPGECLAHA